MNGPVGDRPRATLLRVAPGKARGHVVSSRDEAQPVAGPATNRLSLRVVAAGITVADDADRRTKPPAHLEHITCPSTVAGELRECSSAQR
jgi:hypothetical protein